MSSTTPAAALAGEGHDESHAARHADRAGEAEAEEPALEIAAEFVQLVHPDDWDRLRATENQASRGSTVAEIGARSRRMAPPQPTATMLVPFRRCPAYAEHWLTFWNDLLRNDYTGTG